MRFIIVLLKKPEFTSRDKTSYEASAFFIRTSFPSKAKASFIIFSLSNPASRSSASYFLSSICHGVPQEARLQDHDLCNIACHQQNTPQIIL